MMNLIEKMISQMVYAVEKTYTMVESLQSKGIDESLVYLLKRKIFIQLNRILEYISLYKYSRVYTTEISNVNIILATLDELKSICAKRYQRYLIFSDFKIEQRIIKPDVCTRDSGRHTILGLANCHKFSGYRA